ncbi:MAG: diacylglycerol kinase family protein [Candidatus Fermentibacteraceae bacterium]
MGITADSFGHAFRGLRLLLKTQRNARVHTAVLIVVVAAGFAVGLSSLEWALVVLASALVFSAEAINTALEKLADRVSPEKHPLVRDAKDAAAAAVLISAIGAAVLGALVFIPALLRR